MITTERAYIIIIIIIYTYLSIYHIFHTCNWHWLHALYMLIIISYIVCIDNIYKSAYISY